MRSLFLQMAYVFFLVAFNFVMLNELKDGPTHSFYILLSFVLSFFFEQIRQVKAN